MYVPACMYMYLCTDNDIQCACTNLAESNLADSTGDGFYAAVNDNEDPPNLCSSDDESDGHFILHIYNGLDII